MLLDAALATDLLRGSSSLGLALMPWHAHCYCVSPKLTFLDYISNSYMCRLHDAHFTAGSSAARYHISLVVLCSVGCDNGSCACRLHASTLRSLTMSRGPAATTSQLVQGTVALPHQVLLLHVCLATSMAGSRITWQVSHVGKPQMSLA